MSGDATDGDPPSRVACTTYKVHINVHSKCCSVDGEDRVTMCNLDDCVWFSRTPTNVENVIFSRPRAMKLHVLVLPYSAGQGRGGEPGAILSSPEPGLHKPLTAVDGCTRYPISAQR